MKTLRLAIALAAFVSPAAAFNLDGHYALTVATVEGPTVDYCLRLVNQGPLGVYREQGAAYMLVPPSKSYTFLGQYRLFNHQITVVVGNYGQTPEKWLFLRARIHGEQITDTWFNDGVGGLTQLGTITQTRNGGKCQST